MTVSITERRQIENEMIFRRANEKVGISLDALDAMHVADGNHDLVRDKDLVLHFLCECSDENCNARLPIRLDVYQKIHLNRSSFVVKLKHQVQAIEKVILTEDTYAVVEKNNHTSDPGTEFNKTSINNT
jgi:hypothetical protein